MPFVVECDASESTISATLNQAGRPVAFMSRTLQGSELHYPAVEKEATAIIEAVRKWSDFLHKLLVAPTRAQRENTEDRLLQFSYGNIICRHLQN